MVCVPGFGELGPWLTFTTFMRLGSFHDIAREESEVGVPWVDPIISVENRRLYACSVCSNDINLGPNMSRVSSSSNHANLQDQLDLRLDVVGETALFPTLVVRWCSRSHRGEYRFHPGSAHMLCLRTFELELQTSLRSISTFAILYTVALSPSSPPQAVSDLSFSLATSAGLP